MRKFLIILSLFILTSVSANAQLKLGITGSVGMGSKGTVTPLDSFKVVSTLGITGEARISVVFLRTGYLFQTDKRQFIPVQLFVRILPSGLFVGGGASFSIAKGKSMWDVVLGHKFSRHFDLSLQFSHPFKGNISEGLLALRLTYYPLSTRCTSR